MVSTAGLEPKVTNTLWNYSCIFVPYSFFTSGILTPLTQSPLCYSGILPIKLCAAKFGGSERIRTSNTIILLQCCSSQLSYTPVCFTPSQHPFLWMPNIGVVLPPLLPSILQAWQLLASSFYRCYTSHMPPRK